MFIVNTLILNQNTNISTQETQDDPTFVEASMFQITLSLWISGGGSTDALGSFAGRNVQYWTVVYTVLRDWLILGCQKTRTLRLRAKYLTGTKSSTSNLRPDSIWKFCLTSIENPHYKDGAFMKSVTFKIGTPKLVKRRLFIDSSRSSLYS